jgi:hypothetical protein
VPGNKGTFWRRSSTLVKVFLISGAGSGLLMIQLSDFSVNKGVRRGLLRFYQKVGSFQGQKCNNASLTLSENRQSRKLSDDKFFR